MGVYVSIRGWLECDETQLAAIRTIVTAHDDGFYSGGWATPRRHVNWTFYVFFGADVRQQAVDWFQGQLHEIARVPASDEDGDRVRGLFLASHETDGMTEWHVRDGELHATPGDGRYAYLDE